MESAFSFLLFCFAGLLLIYAGLLALSKTVALIPRHYAVIIKDERAYVRQFAKVVALVAAAPVLGGIAGLFAGPGVAAIVLIAALVACIWLGTRIMKKVL